MNYCSQKLNGIPASCDESAIGGLLEVLIANKGDLATLGLNDKVVDADDKTLMEAGIEISKLTLNTGADKFKSFYFKKGNASMTSTMAFDPSNSGTTCTTELALTFLRYETAKRIEFMALCTGDFVALVKDAATGRYKFMGFDFPVNATAGTIESGAQMSDGNKMTITLTDTSFAAPYFVKTAAVPGATPTDTDFVDLEDIIG